MFRIVGVLRYFQRLIKEMRELNQLRYNGFIYLCEESDSILFVYDID